MYLAFSDEEKLTLNFHIHSSIICVLYKHGIFSINVNTGCNIFLAHLLAIEISTFVFNALSFPNWAKLFICYKFALTWNEKKLIIILLTTA